MVVVMVEGSWQIALKVPVSCLLKDPRQYFSPIYANACDSGKGSDPVPGGKRVGCLFRWFIIGPPFQVKCIVNNQMPIICSVAQGHQLYQDQWTRSSRFLDVSISLHNLSAFKQRVVSAQDICFAILLVSLFCTFISWILTSGDCCCWGSRWGQV